MKLTFKLNENDFLQHQLFVASKTDRIKRQRIKSWLVYSAAFLVLGLLFYESGNKFMAVYFLVFGVLSLCFFPLYQKWYYKNHYKKYINETYKNRFGQTADVEFTEDMIKTNDNTGESKINLTEIESVSETSQYFYLKMKTGGHLVVPKSASDDTENLREELKRFCTKMSIAFIDDLTWRWK